MQYFCNSLCSVNKPPTYCTFLSHASEHCFWMKSIPIRSRGPNIWIIPAFHFSKPSTPNLQTSIAKSNAKADTAPDYFHFDAFFCFPVLRSVQYTCYTPEACRTKHAHPIGKCINVECGR